LAKVQPDNDVPNSYGFGPGQKRYNDSCDELTKATSVDGTVSDAFLRTCPIGVKSCFGAFGYYDHGDLDPSNDLSELMRPQRLFSVQTVRNARKSSFCNE
jgi:hypothetical protein